MLVIGVLVAGVISGAGFALSIGAADFCTDANQYDVIARPYRSKSRRYFVSAISNKVATYYIACSPDGPNPYQVYRSRAIMFLTTPQSQISLIYSYIDSAKQYTDEVDAYYPDVRYHNYSPHPSFLQLMLSDQVLAVNASAEMLLESISCPIVHAVYVDAVTNMCNDLM